MSRLMSFVNKMMELINSNMVRTPISQKKDRQKLQLSNILKSGKIKYSEMATQMIGIYINNSQQNVPDL